LRRPFAERSVQSPQVRPVSDKMTTQFAPSGDNPKGYRGVAATTC
jgi:hypothetical protein